MADAPALPDLPQLSRTLLAYTMWADREHLDSLSRLPVEHLTVPTGTSFGCLLGTMAHILGSERVWLARFVGAPLERYPEVDDWPDLPAVRAGFEELWTELEFFLASLSAELLAIELAWVSRGGTGLPPAPLGGAGAHEPPLGLPPGAAHHHAPPARPPGRRRRTSSASSPPTELPLTRGRTL